MSTESDSKPESRGDEWKIAAAQESSHLSESAASLEGRLETEQDSRREERFYWIFGVILLGNALVFPDLGYGSATFIFLMELILLIGLADYLGVDRVVTLLENLLNNKIRRNGK